MHFKNFAKSEKRGLNLVDRLGGVVIKFDKAKKERSYEMYTL